MNKQPLPESIFRHITTHSIQQLEPAWLQLEPHTENIKAVGGVWQHYLKQTPEVGRQASEWLEILLGMLPLEESFSLPQIQLQDEQYTDIFAIHEDDSDWILCCDVTQNTLQLQQYQQVSNELTLLKSQLKQTLNRYVGQEVSQRISSGDMQLDVAGERKTISTLFVDIRSFTPFNECHDAQVVMQALNDYMSCMLPPIMTASGMIDKIMGDGVMAVFGILSSENNHHVNALQAAKDMVNRVYILNQERQQLGLEQLGIGVGIASGEAVLGILGSHERRTFTAIGRHVNFAARLESNARVGEILIDTTSYNALSQPDNFSPTTLTLKGIGQSEVFSYTMPCIEAEKGI